MSVNSARKPRPWWQQATALVTVSTGGVITGLSFAPGSPATLTSPNGVPLHLMAMDLAANGELGPSPAGSSASSSADGDSRLRPAIVNIARHYLQQAKSKTSAEMEALIWGSVSTDGADHGPSGAAFACLALELAAQATGQQSWVSGGDSYPWPVHSWADPRVDPNPESVAVTSILQDAKTHGRWHPLGDGYTPLPGDWVLLGQRVEVVTSYADGVLHTIAASSLPGYTVNAHTFTGSLATDGVQGFVDNGHLATARPPAPEPTPTSAPTPAPTPTPTEQGHSAAGHDAPAPKSPQKGTSTPRQNGPAPQSQPTATGGADIPGLVPPATGQPTVRQPATGSPAPGNPATRSPAPGNPATGKTQAPRPKAAQPRASHPRVNHTAVRRPLPRTTASQADIPGVMAPGNPAKPTAPTTPAAPTAPTAPAKSGSAPTSGRPASGTPATGAPATGKPAAGKPATSKPSAAKPSTGKPAPGKPSAAKPQPYRRSSTQTPAGTPGTSYQAAFINAIAPGAQAAQRRWGVPAAVTIAQAIEESGWGQSSLAATYHNLFGIKGTGPAGSALLPTQEFEGGQWITIDAPFRAYHNDAESITDHAQLLATSGYYTRAMADRDFPDAFANDLTGVYATDPNYGSSLISLMKLYNLYQYDVPAAPAPAHTAAPSHPSAPSHPAAPTHASSPSHASSTGPAPAATPTAPRPVIPGAMPPPGTTAAGAPTAPTGAAPTRTAPTGTAPTHAAAARGNAVIPGVPDGYGSPAGYAAPAGYSVPGSYGGPAGQPTATSARVAAAGASVAGAATMAFTRPMPAGRRPAKPRPERIYDQGLPTAVTLAFQASARRPIARMEPMYKDIAGQSGISWKLLAACDWMQCQAQPHLSPVHGERLGTVNPDGTAYTTRSAALAQCAADLLELALVVYGIDLTVPRRMSIQALADVFAAFRWGGLLRKHRVSSLEFPYSVEGLTEGHAKMRWPAIDEPNAPDKPGTRFKMPFGAVPVVLSLSYRATV
ncbi:MAG TPA: glucosaminidase domain-containing protein [Trebonia sp.]|nr:glucosaminidase domain-containing protein [Trebonia sp.]